MSRRSLPLFLLPFSAALPQIAASQTPTKPNIIHIIVDDVGYDDLGCFGSKDIRTPNIDALVAKGMKFTDFYAPHGTSTPSRAALLTGRYAPRVNQGAGLYVLFPHSTTGLEDEQEVCIAEILKEQGYTTGIYGKWHLGHLPQYLPYVHGFDQFVGIPFPNDHGPERLGGTGVRSSGITDPMITLMRQGQVVQYCDNNDLGELPNLFRREACRFMYEAVDAQKPFYLHYANIETHTPYYVPKGFENRSKAGAYGDAVEYLDNTVGVLLDMVKRLKIEENTWIIFSSDNGPLVGYDRELENCYGRAGYVDSTRTHVLRGGKYQERYEGGIRVCSFMVWPGVIPAGSTCNELTTAMDIFTVMANVSGGKTPSDRPIDGRDIMPLMRGEKGAKSPHQAVFGFKPRGGLSSVRYQNWKLVLPLINKDGKDISPPELYDLSTDLGETRNLAAQQPNLVKQMTQMGQKADQAIAQGENL